MRRDADAHATPLAEAADALREGRAIILFDAERENEGDLAFPARACTADLVNLCLREARGLLCVALPSADATRIGVERLPSNGRDPFGTPFGFPVSLRGHGSGIAASARAATIRATADVRRDAAAFVVPGHVSTLLGHPEGFAARAGHTEAILALLKSARIEGPGVLCEILGQSGDVASLEDLRGLARRLGAPLVSLSELRDWSPRSA
ncbi:MAG: 3,4-dihydroxy-2-butanone-4-phosphate synthase [Tepidisphaeraceae bacterium]